MTISALVLALPLAGLQAGSAVPLPSVTQPAAAEAPQVTPPVLSAAGAEPTPAPAAQGDTPAQEEDLVVTARPDAPPEDPLQSLNVETFSAIQSVDKAVTGPVAVAYKKSVPSPIRSGLRNLLSNLQEPVVALNYLLQLKPGKSAETLGRFAINSTIGVAGLFDVSKKRPFNLPRRNNGFAYTLGYYGVKSGPFMYLPLIGPTTLRDLVGRMADLSVMPAVVGAPFNDPKFAIPTTVVRLIDERAEADEAIRDLRENSSDPYSTVRENYLRAREAEIDALHGRRPASDYVPAGTSDAGTVVTPQ